MAKKKKNNRLKIRGGLANYVTTVCGMPDAQVFKVMWRGMRKHRTRSVMQPFVSVLQSSHAPSNKRCVQQLQNFSSSRSGEKTQRIRGELENSEEKLK